MPIHSQKKTHPCEGCRERKKKCSGEYPCARCDRLGNECVFLRPTLPPDHAYVDLLQEQGLSLEVETLNSALLDMERTIIQLRRDTSDNNNSNGDIHRTQQPLMINSSSQQRQQQQQDTIVQNWQLILGKHGVTVNTSIKSYSDLLQQAELWQQACQSFITPPLFRSTTCTLSSSGMLLRRQLPLWLLRRGYYMAVTICIKSQQNVNHSDSANSIISSSKTYPQHQFDSYHYHQQQPSPPLSEHEDNDGATIPPLATYYNNDSNKLCRRILDTFFACYIVRYTILHQSTFYRLFVTPETSPLDSPVVCAVCAVALTLRCRYMLPSIPYEQQAQMADMLYRRARDLMDFDEPTLATFVVLTFLALYKEILFCVDDAAFYLDLAFRTRCILVNDNKDDDGDDESRGEDELIKRLHWALWEVQTSVEYYKNQRGVPQSTTAKTQNSTPCSSTRSPNSIVALMMKNKHQYRRHPLPDEPPVIHQALRIANYRSEMMAIQGSFLRQVRFGYKDTIDVNFLAETEYRFSKYYYQDVPADCRMPSRVLEEGLSDAEFRERLDTLWGKPCEQDACGCIDDDDNRMAVLNLASQYFQGIISLYESFLPDLNDRQRAQDAGLLKDDGDTPCFTGSSKTDNTTPTKPTTTPPYENTTNAGESKVTMHQLRAQQKCTHAATTIVRLLDYQRSLRGHCTVNVQILLTAWDIHMRNACIGMVLPSPQDVTDNNNTMYFQCLSLASIHQARRSLLQCLSILREGYYFNFAEHAIWKYYDRVEQQLKSCLYGSSPSTAPAPAPVTHWIPC